MMCLADHRVTLVQHTRVRDGRTIVTGFHGSCSCGESSDRFPSAGLVSGWEAAHREEAGEL